MAFGLDQWLGGEEMVQAYHLKLVAENIADTIIIVGDPERVDQVAARFDSITFENSNREFRTKTGLINNHPISVISSGIGVDNIDILLNELEFIVNHKKVTRRVLNFIRLGTTGAINENIAPGEKIVSRYAIGIEGLMHHYSNYYNKSELAISASFARGQFIPVGTALPYCFSCSESLNDLFPKNWRRGITLTSNGFYAPQFRAPAYGASTNPLGIRDLSSFFCENLYLTNIEMECSGIYGLSKLFQHQAITICVVLANRSTGEICEDIGAATSELIDTSIEVIGSTLLKKA